MQFALISLRGARGVTAARSSMACLKALRPSTLPCLIALAGLTLAGCHEQHGQHAPYPPLAVAPPTATKPYRQVADARIPLPGAALLKPAKAPKCEDQAARLDIAPATAPSHIHLAALPEPRARVTNDAVRNAPLSKHVLNQSETSSDLATRIRIEYDRECYKQAEARVRGQLDKLQVSVKETIKAVNGPPPPERRQPATP